MNPLSESDLDAVTVDLIFALRSSLTDVSLLDFWSGRVTTAISTAAAGSDSAGQAITTACRKLQIGSPAAKTAPDMVRIAERIDADYQAWASHVSRNIIYIVAIAMADRDNRKTTKSTKPATRQILDAMTEEIPF